MKAGEHGSRTEGYRDFESQVRLGLSSLTVPPISVDTRLTYRDVAIFKNVEFFEIEARFPGANCLINFGESVAEPGLFSCQVEFQRPGEEPLFLRDYLADRKDRRAQQLKFTERSLPKTNGIARMVEVLVEMMNGELLPLLKGKIWITAPFDWGPYK